MKNGESVFIVIGSVYYEFDEIVAVVATRPEADALIKEFKTNRKLKWGKKYDEVEAAEWKIGEVMAET